MKIQKYNAGALTNFEVLEFLKSKGASNDDSRIMSPISASEFKVYDYLVQTAACNQTKEIVDEFLEQCKPFRIAPYNLSKAEILNIINIRPSTVAHIYPIIEKVEARLGQNEYDERLEKLVEMVVEVLPAPPEEEVEEAAEEGDDEEANADGEEMEES